MNYECESRLYDGFFVGTSLGSFFQDPQGVRSLLDFIYSQGALALLYQDSIHKNFLALFGWCISKLSLMKLWHIKESLNSRT